MAWQLQLTPPHMGQTLELSSLHKTQPQSMYMSTEKSNLTPKLNFRDVDWDELQTTLKENLNNLPQPVTIKDIPTFKRKLNELNKAMWDVINKHVNLSKACPYSKRWWMHKLTEEKRITRRLGRQAKTFHFCTSHPIHEQYQNQCNKYAELLRKTKTTQWDEWLKDLDESNVWQASRFIATPPTDAAKSRIPTLQVKDPVTKQMKKEAISNKDKGDRSTPQNIFSSS